MWITPASRWVNAQIALSIMAQTDPAISVVQKMTLYERLTRQLCKSHAGGCSAQLLVS
jgi:hypothetical protein